MRLSASLFLTIAFASRGAEVIIAQSRTPATLPSDASHVIEPCTVSALRRGASYPSSGNGDALGNLALQRAKWRAQQLTSYRLCVATFNPLIVTITESEVVDGVIRTAREVIGRAAMKDRLEPEDWSLSSGYSVELLFDEIQRGFRNMQAPARSGEPRFVTTAGYDPTLGYPVYTDTRPAPGAQRFDAGVETLIRLTPLPASR